jgi:hypothetical protein
LTLAPAAVGAGDVHRGIEREAAVVEPLLHLKAIAALDPATALKGASALPHSKTQAISGDSRIEHVASTDRPCVS